MRNYTLGFTLNVLVLGVFIYILSFATTADGSADGVCEKVDCVKGECVETGAFLGLGFECVCDPGWTQMQLGPVAFPACTVPNCTLDLGCKGRTPSPHLSPPSSPFKITDPCSLIWCGNGKCEITGTGYDCKCNEGSTQYMNMSKLPCLDECALGANCKGVTLDPLRSLPPPPSPGHDGPCKYVDCAKGKCVETGEFFELGFRCNCDPGWTQIQVGPLTYPACNVPNCTLNLGCGNQQAASPPLSPASFNIFDPCSLVWCNNGKCEVNGTKHYCQCNEGSENLMDVPELPCFDQCVFGADCKGLELGGNQPIRTPPAPPGNGSSGVPKDPNGWRSLRAFSVLLLLTISTVLI
ncbi:protein jagged-1 [Capsicum annuum]|uniref:protein jagged-1 n=1 Tax=Capsicum annuum TaxID=4072 RepID=UPI001FB06BE4|nr:protein jagged-1 [Capsicum annuum]